MIHTLLRTNSANIDFITLVAALDADLAVRDGSEHSFYAQFNKLDLIRHVVIAYKNNTPAGCGAIKEFSAGVMEVKRMYVPEQFRGGGVASAVLQELEKWAKEMQYEKCVLETGKKQPEAIGLYRKNGYSITANYGQYIGVENSVCFEKKI